MQEGNGLHQQNKATPYLFQGKHELDFGPRLQLVLLGVDETKICYRRPINAMKNACFVIDRLQLKSSDDWLVTDIGSFENRGSSARIYVIQNDKIVKSWPCNCKGTQAERSKHGRGEFLARNVFERHRKHTDLCEIQLSSIVVAVKHSHWG